MSTPQKIAKLTNGPGAWNGGPWLVEWFFEAGEHPSEGLVVREGEERYDGADVVRVRRFEAINGSRDVYLRFCTYVPRAEAIRRYRQLLTSGFSLVKPEAAQTESQLSVSG